MDLALNYFLISLFLNYFVPIILNEIGISLTREYRLFFYLLQIFIEFFKFFFVKYLRQIQIRPEEDQEDFFRNLVQRPLDFFRNLVQRPLDFIRNLVQPGQPRQPRQPRRPRLQSWENKVINKPRQDEEKCLICVEAVCEEHVQVVCCSDCSLTVHIECYKMYAGSPTFNKRCLQCRGHGKLGVRTIGTIPLPVVGQNDGKTACTCGSRVKNMRKHLKTEKHRNFVINQ